MPMWMWSWDGPGGYAWICPLLGSVAIVAMAFICLRRMGGMSGCDPRYGQPAAPEVEKLHRETERLRGGGQG